MGATLAPIILASNSTRLSVLGGDKTAWPVYLSLANVAKHVRRQVDKRAMLLLGYIPYTKLECFAPGERSAESQ